MLTNRDTGYPAEWWYQREGEPTKFYTERAAKAAASRVKPPAPKPKAPVAERAKSVRPVSATCEACGTTFPVGPRGYIPRYCGRTCRDRMARQRQREVSMDALRAAKHELAERRKIGGRKG